MNTFKKVTLKHLEEYLPDAIDQFGYVILHGDGNMYVNNADTQKEHQPSYLAKTFAGIGNEPATYVVRFDKKSDIPETLEQMDKLFLDTKAQEQFNEGALAAKDSFKGLKERSKKADDTENEDLKAALEASETARLDAEIIAENAKKEIDELKTLLEKSNSVDESPAPKKENKK